MVNHPNDEVPDNEGDNDHKPRPRSPLQVSDQKCGDNKRRNGAPQDSPGEVADHPASPQNRPLDGILVYEAPLFRCDFKFHPQFVAEIPREAWRSAWM